MKFTSTDVLRLRTYLERYHVSFSGADHFLVMEAACLSFFPNHIETVIKQVLGGKNQDAKRAKANTQGWAYFHAPVCQLLKSREGAQRSDAVDIGLDSVGVARRLYVQASSSLVVAPFTHDEIRMLLVDVVALDPSDEEMRRAIAICKERDARTVQYLHGILSRDRAKRDATLQEARAETGTSPWEPPPGYSPVRDLDRLSDRWRELQAEIDWMREHGETS